MSFELLFSNYFNTTTQATVDSNTDTVVNLLVRDERFQYSTSGLNDDNTTASITIAFDSTQPVSRIALVNHNLQSFTLFYNGATASTFSLTAGQITSTSDFSTNSETSHYFVFDQVNCTSVTIDMKQTIVADNEKAIGWFAISDVITDFDGRVPPAQTYRPTIEPKQVIHTMSDGSTRVQTLQRKYRVEFSLDFVEPDTRNEIKTAFDLYDEMIFSAFGTSSGWDEFIFPCVWIGSFDFFTYTDNSVHAGHSGIVTLREI